MLVAAVLACLHTLPLLREYAWQLFEGLEGELLHIRILSVLQHLVGDTLLEIVPGRIQPVRVREDHYAIHLIEDSVGHMKHL